MLRHALQHQGVARRLSRHLATASTAGAPRGFFRRHRRGLAASGAVVGAAVGLRQYALHDLATLSDEGLSTEYDPAVIDAFWRRHVAVVVWRMCIIGGEVLPFLAKLAWHVTMNPRPPPGAEGADADAGDNDGGSHESAAAREARLTAAAREFRGILTRLGPTWIKFGQMLSIRPDVLPTPVLQELRKLCDSVPPYSTAKALQLIESQLGRPVADVFLDLGPGTQPIAAASLGQVYVLAYRCRLRATGETVAVKVQRPDMLRTVTLDLFLLRRYFRVVEACKEVLMDRMPDWVARRRQFDVQLCDTFARASLHELDYVHEGRNQEFFAMELRKRMPDDVYVPAVHWDASSAKVLCSEWISGRPLASASPEEIRRLVPVGVECFLVQLLELGTFHSDPHPGNLFVEDAPGGGPGGRRRLVLLDFGLCATLERPSMLRLARALVHLLENDIPALLEDGVHLGFLDHDADLDTLGPALEQVLNQGREAAAQAATETAEEAARTLAASMLDPAAASQHGVGGGEVRRESAVQRRKRKFGAISAELNDMFFKYPFTVPEYFALVVRALIVLEGIALTGDPEFDIFSAAYPYARRQALRAVTGLSLAAAAELIHSAQMLRAEMQQHAVGNAARVAK